MVTVTARTGIGPRAGAHIALVVMSAVLMAVLGFVVFRPIKVMPYLAVAPSYQLTSQEGRPVSNSDLYGRVVLYDFIYTHCTTVCPAMTGQMLQIQRRLAAMGLSEDVALVSITFDPQRDTPERLREYAERMNADQANWLWLTGDKISIKRLVGSDFGVYFEQVPIDRANAVAAGLSEEEIASGYDFIHAVMFVLVDEKGMIRAEYRELMDVEQMVRDIRLVVNEKNAVGPARLLWQAAHLIRAYP
jgi:protein SCO1/2